MLQAFLNLMMKILMVNDLSTAPKEITEHREELELSRNASLSVHSTTYKNDSPEVNDWIKLALILDRLFLLVYLIVNLLTSTVIFARYYNN